MQSLRGRLLLRTTIGLCVLFTLAGIILYLLIRASLTSEFDSSLTAEARALASVIEQNGHRVKVELEPGQMPEFATNSRSHYFELWSADGASLAKSPSLGSANLTPPSAPGDLPGHAPLLLPDLRAGRVVTFIFQPRREDEEKGSAIPTQILRLAVARQTDDLDHTLNRLRWLLAAVFATSIVTSVIIVGLVIGLGLRPLQTLAQSIERVGVADLSERIEPGGTPREVMPVVQRLNDLLSRLDAALSREKSFTANVAHELRTPLSGLETALEVCSSRERSASEYQGIIARCLRVTQSMHSMVNTLLLLARADAAQLVVDEDAVEMDAFVQECWEPFRERAAGRGLDVRWECKSNSVIRVDAEKLRIVLNNLFDNAVTYANEGGNLYIATSIEAGSAMLQITNSGSQMTADDAGHVFDRFWRGDVSRTGSGLHCGLGLSLCRKMMEMLGGAVAVCAEGGNFRASVVIPRAAAPSHTVSGKNPRGAGNLNDGPTVAPLFRKPS